MYKIVKATSKDAKLLSKIGIESFLTAHGHSAPKKDIDNYITNNLSEVNFTSELKDLKNIFHLLYVHNKLAGYSKVIFNKTNINVSNKNVTNMSRLYLLKDFYGMGLGKILLDFNIKLCKENKQSGLWLVVWVENQKAIKFYNKNGFKKVGNFNFQISENHSNPNHVMYLEI